MGAPAFTLAVDYFRTKSGRLLPPRCSKALEDGHKIRYRVRL